MTEAAAPRPDVQPLHRLRTALTAHPAATATGFYAIVALAAAVVAYVTIFAHFAPYDDEGTLLVTLRAFADGDTLYRDVYSPYGPFYYELFGGLFALTGWSVTTDASRLIVIVVWVAASLLYGVSVQRLTGRLLLGVTAMIVAFAVLGALASEPMHPHGLGVLLLGGLTLHLVSGPPRRLAVAGAATGVLLAALTLTKINLGALAIAALALTAVLTAEPLYRRRWLRWPVVAAFLALPAVLMARELREEWVRDLIALELLATAAILVVAWPARPGRGEDEAGLSRWLLAAAAGAALAAAVMLGSVMLTGPGPADLYDGIVEQGLRIGDVFTIPLESPPVAVDWGIAALAAAALTVWLRPADPEAPSVWPGLLRVVAGLVIWLTVARSAPVSLNPAGNQIALPLVLAWVAAIAPAGLREPPYRRFLRVLLPTLAVAETLQVYPVAGSQVGIASVTFVAVGGLCIGDGLVLLRAWGAARGREGLKRVETIAAVAIVALAGKFALDTIVRPGAAGLATYRSQPASSLPGAGRLRIPSPQVDEYERLVELLRSHGCTTFVGYPNVNNLYLWSSIDPPKPSAPGAWVIVLDGERQQRVVEQMRASPRPCAIRNDALAGGWLHDSPPPDTPLVRYIFNEFEPVAAVGEFRLLLPKDRARG